MKKILLTEKIHESGMDFLKENFDLTIAEDTSKETLLKQIKGKDAIIIRSSQLYNELIDEGDKLKVIGRHGAGLDNIDVEYATEKGVTVVNTPTANTESVAEHTLALILALNKKLTICDRAIRKSVFSEKGASLPGLCTSLGYSGYDVANKTLGIIGFGNIGHATAELLKRAFNVKVIVYDKFLQEKGGIELEQGYRWAEDLDDILENSDFISIHVPLLPSTKHMISTEEFNKMKPTGYIINCARGGVIDEVALCKALDENQIAGAGIDVFEEEPINPDNPMLKNDKIIMTPHAAAMSHESIERMAMQVCEGVASVLNGEKPFNQVN